MVFHELLEQCLLVFHCVRVSLSAVFFGQPDVPAIEMKNREGKYGGGVAPYGYQKSEKKKGTFEVDEEAAEVVRYIFELRSRGYGYCSIVKDLNEKRIKSPSAYRFEKGIVKNQKMKDVIWKRYAIEDMLREFLAASEGAVFFIVGAVVSETAVRLAHTAHGNPAVTAEE